MIRTVRRGHAEALGDERDRSPRSPPVDAAAPRSRSFRLLAVQSGDRGALRAGLDVQRETSAIRSEVRRDQLSTLSSNARGVPSSRISSDLRDDQHEQRRQIDAPIGGMKRRKKP